MAQTITWVAASGDMIASGALQTEQGKSYRVTGTVDTSGVPLGTPVEFRIGYSGALLTGRESEQRSMLGQCVVYADGSVQPIDIRWTDFTENGVCYFGQYVTGEYLGRASQLRRPGAVAGDALTISDLVFEEYLDTLHGSSGTIDQNSIRKGGVEFIFNRNVRVGKYANGDFWFRDLDPGNPTPLQITSIWPESETFYLDRASDGTNAAGDPIWKITPAPGSTDDFYTVHGTELNPWIAGWEMRSTVTAGPEFQAFEDRYDTSIRTHDAPYGSPIYLKRQYDAAFNVDPGPGGANAPLTVVPDDSVVKSLGWVEPMSRGSSGTRTRTGSHTIITCVASDPPSGSFRPYPGDVSKAPLHNISDLDLSLLPDLASPALTNAPNLADAKRMRYHYQCVHIRQNPPNEGIIPSLAASPYSRDFTSEQSRHMMGGIISDAFTTAEKNDLAIGVVQYGLDMYRDNLIRGNAWPESGGKLCKKPFAVVAAVLLQDTAMQNEIAKLQGQFNVYDNAGLPVQDRRYPYNEDCMWARVIPECVTEPRNLYIASTGSRSGMKYFPENVGMPALMDGKSPFRPWDNTTPGWFGAPEGQNLWKASYRTIGANRAIISILAVHVIPGAKAAFGNDAALDWYDMFLRYSSETDDEFIEGILDYDRAFWSAHRTTGIPVAVNRFGLDDEVNYTRAEGASIMSDDYELEAGRPMTEGDWRAKIEIYGVPRLRKFPVNASMTFPLAPEWFVKAGTTTESWLDAASIPTSYTLVSGTLPADLSLNAATGVIEGTPAAKSPLRPDLPDDPTDRANPFTIRATDVTVQAANAHGSSEQMIRFAVV